MDIEQSVRRAARLIGGLVCILLLATACGEEPADAAPTPAELRSLDSLQIISAKQAAAVQARHDAEDTVRISYTPYAISSAADLKNFREQYTSEQRRVILSLNRRDSRHLHYGDTLVVPTPLYDSLMPYSPFPRRLPELTFVPKFTMVSYRVQAFGAYEYGRLVRWGPTSMGKRSTPTPTGLYSVNWKSKRAISTVDRSWILPWNVNVMNFEGVSMHQFDMPGYPASHACMRLLEEDAHWNYGWAESWILSADGKLSARGTPVLIFGRYDYKSPAPWSRLPTNPAIHRIDAIDLRVFRESLGTILEWTSTRDSVLRARREEANTPVDSSQARAARAKNEQSAG